MIYKSLFAVFLVIAFLAVSAALADYFKVVGSKKTHTYHLPDCEVAQKIKPEDLITFNYPKQALLAGYGPCKVCNPPMTDPPG